MNLIVGLFEIGKIILREKIKLCKISVLSKHGKAKHFVRKTKYIVIRRIKFYLKILIGL